MSPIHQIPHSLSGRSTYRIALLATPSFVMAHCKSHGAAAILLALLLASTCGAQSPLPPAPQNTSTPSAIVAQAYAFLTEHLVDGTRCWTGPNGEEPDECYSFHFFRPSMTKYATAQWLWDSGSHMITWSHRNVTNSVLDLRTMLNMQRDNGFIPETIFWPVQDNVTNVNNMWFYNNTETTEISQMPVLAHSLRAIWNQTHSVDLLEEFVPKLVKYWRWWETTRRLSESGLVSILHGWESGLDASPMYDRAYNVSDTPTFDEMYPHFDDLMISYNLYYAWNMSGILGRKQAPQIPNTFLNAWFYVEDIGLNSVYAAGWGILGDLAAEMGNSSLAAECFAKEAAMLENILQFGWSDATQRFASRWRQTDGTWQQTEAETVQSLLPLMVRGLPEYFVDTIVNSQLRNASKFWLPYPVPSTSADSPCFTPDETVDLMWRGPSWGFTNWMVMEGLWVQSRLADTPTKALHLTNTLNELMDRWIGLVEQSGIWEMYNPITGAPYGVEGLGMSCVIVDWMVRLNRVPS